MKKILKITVLSTAGPISGVVLLLGGLTLWLTPARLTAIVNSRLSEYLEADVKADSISYTLWTSFPRLNISTGRISVVSRTLKGVSPQIRRVLPAGADSLASLKSFAGSINVVDLFLNRYVVHDIRIDGLRLNFVAYNDSINNYSILPDGGEQMKRVPYFLIKSMELEHPGSISYYSLASQSRASIRLSSLELLNIPRKVAKDSYRLELAGKIDASSAGLNILTGFPVSLSGDIRLHFNPFGIRLTDYSINLGNIRSKLNMSLGIGDGPRVDEFSYHISSVSLMSLLNYLPKEFIPSMQGIEADMQISAWPP